MNKLLCRTPSSVEFTQLLNEFPKGKTDVMDRLFLAAYQELRTIARQQLHKAWSVETLCVTALVNEAYLKLAKLQQFSPASRAHFFAIAATAMRHILINCAEQKQAQKRGGDWHQVALSDVAMVGEQNINALLAVNKALDLVKVVDESLVRLIELRFFAGMTEAEIALIFDISERSVRRNWKKAKALLAKALEE